MSIAELDELGERVTLTAATPAVNAAPSRMSPAPSIGIRTGRTPSCPVAEQRSVSCLAITADLGDSPDWSQAGRMD